MVSCQGEERFPEMIPENRSTPNLQFWEIERFTSGLKCGSREAPVKACAGSEMHCHVGTSPQPTILASKNSTKTSHIHYLSKCSSPTPLTTAFNCLHTCISKENTVTHLPPSHAPFHIPDTTYPVRRRVEYEG